MAIFLKAGTTVDFDGTELPVFGSVAEAMEKTGADVSVLFVPPAFTKDAMIEAIDGNKTRIIGPRASSPPGSPTRESSRRTSAVRAGSAWSRSPAP
jgi:hypothetical protein